jgi:hypothetical protein
MNNRRRNWVPCVLQHGGAFTGDVTDNDRRLCVGFVLKKNFGFYFH